MLKAPNILLAMLPYTGNVILQTYSPSLRRDCKAALRCLLPFDKNPKIAVSNTSFINNE